MFAHSGPRARRVRRVLPDPEAWTTGTSVRRRSRCTAPGSWRRCGPDRLRSLFRSASSLPRPRHLSIGPWSNGRFGRTW